MDKAIILRADGAIRGGYSEHAAAILATDPEADHPSKRSDSFRGFIQELGGKPGTVMSRTQYKRLRRLGFSPIIAGGAENPTGVIAMLPFTSSAHEHTEPAFTLTPTATTSEQQQNPQNIPATGWLRNVFLEINSSGGVIGTGVANNDFPFSLFSNVLMQEVNGGNIFGPGMTGYDVFLANLMGGYAFRQDVRDMPAYVGTAPNPVFNLRVPAEVSARDGLASLSNQNASALFQLLLSIGALATMYSTVGTVTAPASQIKGWLEAWTLPAPQDSRARPQSQAPPLVGTGQYWSKRGLAVGVGANTVPFTRLGNLLRNIILVSRNAAGDRADNVFPDPLMFNWDGYALQSQVSQRYLKAYAWEKILTQQAVLAGVFDLPFNHGGEAGGKMGNETPELWLGTTQASRLEISGTSAAAGNIYVVTNEVAPIEANPATQYQTPNATGTLAQPASVQAA